MTKVLSSVVKVVGGEPEKVVAVKKKKAEVN